MNEELAPAAIEPTTAEPAVAEQNTTEDVAQKSETTEAKPEKSAEQKELEYLRRKATKADRNNARLYQEREEFKTRLEQLERSRPAEQRQKIEVDPQEVERYVQTKAEQLAMQRDFGKTVDAIVSKGQSEYPDFDRLTSAMLEELPLVDREGNRTPAARALLECDDTAAVIAYLGRNPEVAAELNGLSESRASRRLGAIERELKQPPKPSAAPKPHEPEKSSSSAAMPDPARDPAGWISWRNKQEAEKRKRN